MSRRVAKNRDFISFISRELEVTDIDDCFRLCRSTSQHVDSFTVTVSQLIIGREANNSHLILLIPMRANFLPSTTPSSDTCIVISDSSHSHTVSVFVVMTCDSSQLFFFCLDLLCQTHFPLHRASTLTTRPSTSFPPIATHLIHIILR